MNSTKLILQVLLVLFLTNAFMLWAGANRETGREPSNSSQLPIVNVYSSRHYEVDNTIYHTFTEQTGIKVNIATGKEDELIERIAAEGSGSEMDLLFFADAGRLARAKNKQLLQEISNPAILDRTSPLLQDRDKQWIAISMRARVLIYDTQKGVPNISAYEDIAIPGNAKVLVRSSSHSYNISLIAFLIATTGEGRARAWTKSIVDNLARRPEGNDRDQMRALISGIGDVAVANSYYIGLLQHSDIEADRAVGNRIGVIFPNPTNINISGVAIGKYAKNRVHAEALIAYMLSPEVQALIASKNYEYPVAKGAEYTEFLTSLGEINLPADNFDLNSYAEYSALATQIADESAWN